MRSAVPCREMRSIQYTVLVAGLLTAAVRSCTNNLECSLNGECSRGRCNCSIGWRGEECELLDLTPAPPGGAYGYSPNISSWGAHVVRHPSDDLYHMFVSEFWGNCGVQESWQMDSHVVHAVSKSALGPYEYLDTALPPEATCMHIMMVNQSRIVMYHQGRSGSTTAAALHNCTPGPYVPPHREDWRPTPQHKVHYSDLPTGPWLAGTAEMPMPPGINCENPAPLLLPNGSVAVFCHGPGIRLWLSHTDEPVRFISTEGSYPIPHTVWEDPMVYFDASGNWHLISHVIIRVRVRVRVLISHVIVLLFTSVSLTG